MAYSAGDTILDDEYNNFANDATNNINGLWGAGNGTKGYGQTNTISAVSAGGAINAAQWNTLQDRLASIAGHQGTSINNAAGGLSAGDTVAILANFGADITTVTNARFAVDSDHLDTTANPNSANRSFSGSWRTSTVHEWKVTFASSDAARYFFNAGGSITHTWNLSSVTASDKSNEWIDLFNTKAGTFTLAGATDSLGGSGTPGTNINEGFWNTNLTNGGSYVVLQKQFADSSPYTTNFCQWEVKISGTAGSAGGKGEVVTIKATVDGTLTSSWVVKKPNTDELNNDAVGSFTAAEVSQSQS